jgi:hypothetical protein
MLKVYVSVVSASGVAAADKSGTSDPYAEVSLLDPSETEVTGHAGLKTKSNSKTLEPIWNEEFIFGEDVVISTNHFIRVRLMDKNGMMKKDKPLGEVLIPVLDIKSAEAEDEYTLVAVEDQKLKVSGTVKLKLHRKDPPSTTATAPRLQARATFAPTPTEGGGEGGNEDFKARANRAGSVVSPNQMFVTVMSCKGLPKMDSTMMGKATSSDPQVKLEVGKSKGKTDCIKANVNPVWNDGEGAMFNLACDASGTGLQETLKVTVEDVDTLSNDFMGKVEFPTKDFIDMQEHQGTYELLDKKGKQGKKGKGSLGYITLKIHWKYMVPGDDGDFSSDEGESAEDSECESVKSEDEIDAKPKEGAEGEEEEEEIQDIDIQSGDYQVQIHIIEVRDLAAKDDDGLSDPVVYMECMDQKQNSAVMKGKLSAVFDELFIMNFRNLDKEVVENGVINISVMDADSLSRNDLIGSYSFDVPFVYQQKDHELHRKWLGLTNLKDKKAKGVQGYLKASIVVLGPGDKQKKHDELADLAAEREQEVGGDISKLVMMPASLEMKTQFLVLSIWKAEELPAMDTSMTGLTDPGIDAFIKCSFAGGSKKTKVHKKKAKKGNRKLLKPRFKEEIWLPVVVPTMTKTIDVSVWDYDLGSGNDCVAHTYLNFKEIPLTTHTPIARYYNLYGAPLSVEGKLLEAFNTVKDDMNKFPEKATTYRGKLLISARLDENEDGEKDERPSSFPIKTKLPAKKKPAKSVYRLHAHIIAGSEIPGFSSKAHPGKYSKMGLVVSCGLHEIDSGRKANNKGMVEWGFHQHKDMSMPEDIDQVPDIFLHLYNDKAAKKRICFRRFKAKDILKEKNATAAKWISLFEDDAEDEIRDDKFPGSVLVRFGLTLKEDNHTQDSSYEAEKEALGRKIPYQVRVHCYCGRSLPAVDSNGMLDPYLKIKFCGQELQTTKLKKTRDPQWFETICFDVDLVDNLALVPQINCQVYDYDKFDSDDYCGACHINLNDETMAYELAGDQPRDAMQKPVWHKTMLQTPGDVEGSLLLSVQLVRKSSPTEVIPKPVDISPDYRDAWIEIIALGCRGLKPFEFLPIEMPYMRFVLSAKDNMNKVPPMTEAKRKPSGSNPNYLQRIVLPCKMPCEALYAPVLNLMLHDTRLGGFYKPLIGVAAIPMENKLPWSDNYEAPQARMRTASSMRRDAAGDGAGGGRAGAEGGGEEGEMKEEEEGEEGLPSATDAAGMREWAKTQQGEVDTGAGVFSALLDFEEEEAAQADPNGFSAGPGGGAGGAAGAPAKLLSGDESEEDEEEKPPVWRIDRTELEGSIEEELLTTPFENFDLKLGSQNLKAGKGKDSKKQGTVRITGKFKGLIRVLKSKDEAPLFDLQALLSPAHYLIRCYFLMGKQLNPMDVGLGGKPGKSDPYLKIKLGKEKFNDRKNYVDDVTDVDFYKLVELKAELPGASSLDIQVMDYDFIGGDELIGKTVIDLEDRLFDDRWKAMGKDFETAERWAPKPIEMRDLHVPTSSRPMGQLECWVDIVSPSEASVYPGIDISLPPDEYFEVRVIIWKTRRVKGDFSGMRDLYIKCWFEDTKPQSTDIHWRAKKGKASFNWRLKFKVKLGHRTKAMKYPYFHMQLWDQDIVSFSDCIVEHQEDVGKYFKRAYKKKIPQQVFKTKDPKKKKNAAGVQTQPQAVPPAAGALEETQNPMVADGSAAGAAAGAAAPPGEGVEMTAMGQDGEAVPAEGGAAGAAGEEAGIELSPEQIRDMQNKQAELDAAEEAKQHKEKGDSSEMTELINDVKEMTGLYPAIVPKNSKYLKTQRDGKPMGEVCVSMEVVPMDIADQAKLGHGRNAPNHSPFMPPPSGRLQFSLNPFTMIKELVGPAICFKFMCCLLCVAFVCLMIFAGPLMNMLFTYALSR